MRLHTYHGSYLTTHSDELPRLEIEQPSPLAGCIAALILLIVALGGHGGRGAADPVAAGALEDSGHWRRLAGALDDGEGSTAVNKTLLEIYGLLYAGLFTLLYHGLGLAAGIAAVAALPPTIVAQLLAAMSQWAEAKIGAN